MIKVGMLLAYDYAYVKNSLPLIYPYADQICFALDINRRSWSGNAFSFDESILDWIKSYDTDQKIQIYEDDFCIPGNTAMQNDTRQRQLLADFMGKGGWHVQIDTDEYFLGFEKFCTYLRSKNSYLDDPEKNQICFAVNWINLFKQTPNGFLVISGSNEFARIATNYPHYIAARNLKQRTIFSPFSMIHQSWARDREEVKFKVENWSHNADLKDKNAYFQFWLDLNEGNYQKAKNFAGGSNPAAWKRLAFFEAKTIEELIGFFNKKGVVAPHLFLFKKNLIQWFYAIMGKFRAS